MVAQVARYHRKVPPEPDHEDFTALKASAQKAVMILGGILRIADALDRTHTGKITRIEAKTEDKAIVIQVHAQGSWDAEFAMFETKRDMLQMAAERPVTCKEL